MKKYALLAATIVLGGCATNLNYAPPGIYEFQNQKAIQDDFDQVWKRLEKGFASNFFTRKKFDRKSRVITATFSADEPSKLVDCGFTERHFKNEKGTDTYSYNPADSAVYTIRNNDNFVLNAARKSNLRGKVNIFLAPNESTTTVTVNIRYIIDVNVTYFDLNNRRAGSDDFVFTFSSETDYVEPGIICTTKGKLEQIILNFAEGKLEQEILNFAK